MTLKHSMKIERKTKRDQNNMIKQNKILQYIHDFGASSKIDECWTLWPSQFLSHHAI